MPERASPSRHPHGQPDPHRPHKTGEVASTPAGPRRPTWPISGDARAAHRADVLVRHLRAQGLRGPRAQHHRRGRQDPQARREGGRASDGCSRPGWRSSTRRTSPPSAAPCPDFQPKVSEHIPDIVALVQDLVARGAAYESRCRAAPATSAYAVRAFRGTASSRSATWRSCGSAPGSRPAGRSAIPSTSPLWKGCTGEAWGWDCPGAGGGRAAHRECSAMAARYRGTGSRYLRRDGSDLPHHENEIAQSEAAHLTEGPSQPSGSTTGS